ISATKARLEARLAALLVLQHRLSQELARCEQVLVRIAEARAELFTQLTARSSPPVWVPELWTSAAKEIPDAWREAVDTLDRVAERLVRSQTGRLPLLILILVGFVAVLYHARDGIRRSGGAAGTLSAVFEHFISTAVVLTTFVGALLYADELV